jgi:hypothetical protein
LHTDDGKNDFEEFLTSVWRWCFSFVVDGGDDDEAGIYHHPMGKKKKKRQRESVEEQLISVLEKSSQDLQQHLSLDRELRKEQARGLVEVLNKLVDVIGTMAEAMQRR